MAYYKGGTYDCISWENCGSNLVPPIYNRMSKANGLGLATKSSHQQYVDCLAHEAFGRKDQRRPQPHGRREMGYRGFTLLLLLSVVPMESRRLNGGLVGLARIWRRKPGTPRDFTSGPSKRRGPHLTTLALLCK
jgi:hypothetical protein